MTIPLILHCLSAWIFGMGVFTLLIRRNTIVLLMGIEMMLNAVNLSFITFAREHGHLLGQMQVIFIITLAAAESAVGLAIIVHLYRHFGHIRTKGEVAS